MGRPLKPNEILMQLHDHTAASGLSSASTQARNIAAAAARIDCRAADGYAATGAEKGATLTSRVVVPYESTPGQTR
jgi:hypothetical protein